MPLAESNFVAGHAAGGADAHVGRTLCTGRRWCGRHKSLSIGWRLGRWHAGRQFLAGDKHRRFGTRTEQLFGCHVAGTGFVATIVAGVVAAAFAGHDCMIQPDVGSPTPLFDGEKQMDIEYGQHTQT